jgi:ABC-2 type transport system permease protein
MNKYILFWLKQSNFSLQTVLASKWGSLIFIVGKLLRYFLFLVIIINIASQTKQIAGYTLNQLVVFYLVYTFVDTITQMLFRGIYFFREMLIDGRFDYYLLRPINPLFQVMTAYTDPLDIPLLLIVSIGLLIQSFHAVFMNIVLYWVTLVLSFVIMLAIHILIAAFGIIFLEIDNIVMFMRDIYRMGQVPVDIYEPAIRFAVSYIIPIAIIMNVPAKALLGIMTLQHIAIALVMAVGLLYTSLYLWNLALKQYSSASS